MENSLLYPLHIYFRHTKINIILIVLTSSVLLFLFQYLSNSGSKIVSFRTYENPELTYLFLPEELDLYYTGDNSYSLYDKIITKLYLEKIQSKALNSLNLDKDRNLEIINYTFDSILDRERYKIVGREEYIQTFRTYLGEKEARIFIDKLLEISNQTAKKDIEFIINLQITNLLNKIKLKETEIKRNYTQKLTMLEINSKFEDDLYKLNIDRSIGVLKNNLTIANKLNYVEIQKNSYEKNIITEPNSVFEVINPRDVNKQTFDTRENSTIKFSTPKSYIDSLESKLTNTSNKNNNMILVNSLNNPIFLLGSKLLEEEIKILSQGSHLSLEDSRSFNILLKQQLEDSLDNSIKNDALIIDSKIEIEILKNLNSKMNDIKISFIKYNPSSIDYQASLPSINILIFFSFFIGVLVSIIYRIVVEAYNYKSNN